MPIDDLVKIIETLKARIGQHHDILRKYETQVRGSLIDPLLRALGWDVEDPKIVRLEYSIGNERADYALMKPDGRPSAVIEAKKLGAPFDDKHLAQMLNYAIRADIEYACLSDGDQWKLYSVFERGSFEEKCRLDVSIAKTPTHECALKLLTLWQSNLASDQPVEAADPIFKPEPPAPDPEPTPIPGPPPPDGWTPLSECRPQIGALRPSAIRLPDESERSITTWIAVLMTTAEWLCEKNYLTTDKLPVRVSPVSRKYIVSASNIHGTGREMVRPGIINNGKYYVDKDVNCMNICRNARTLLEHCGADPSQTYLKQPTANDASPQGRRQTRRS